MTAREPLPEWEAVLRAAARLQGILPDAALVGGTAAAPEAGHRRSMDADHVIGDLIDRYDAILVELEAQAGWRTKRRQRPVAIMGRLDGIMTTVRHLRRSEPLETRELETAVGRIRVPTPAEILRIKSFLIVDRNAARDYLDVAAISEAMGLDVAVRAMAALDHLYPQPDDAAAVRQQLMRQLAHPQPYDLEEVGSDLAEYRDVADRWNTWDRVVGQCALLAVAMAEAVATRRAGWTDLGGSS